VSRSSYAASAEAMLLVVSRKVQSVLEVLPPPT
jgi:hypothetical protein